MSRHSRAAGGQGGKRPPQHGGCPRPASNSHSVPDASQDRPAQRVHKASGPAGRVLPATPDEVRALGWDAPDILLVSGDAYVDHPSFGTALLGRWLTDHGFRVAIVDQPPWQQRDEALSWLTAFGRPRLFAGVTAGAIDSMLAHYTAFRKKRHDDAYTPGGKAGARPNRASVVYTGLVRQAFPGLPVVLGGIEASLRRISHYDFWADALKRPLLLDSKADMLIYGMGENALLAIARKAEELVPSDQPIDRVQLTAACRDIPGIAWTGKADEVTRWFAERNITPISLPSYDAILEDCGKLMQSALALEKQVHHGRDHATEPCGDRTLVLNPPAPALQEQELDRLYALPYTRLPHPRHVGPIPAWEMIRTSITTHRGCGGGCSFCSLALHQGRHISSRSRKSVLAEAEAIAAGPDPTAKAPRWAGSISDVGGPSANMWQAQCALPEGKECARASCMHPAPCTYFKVDQNAGVSLLRSVAALPGVNHVRVASGVRFDLALQEPQALAAYCSEFTGGQLKVAPEHSEEAVLRLMRKPAMQSFERFLDVFAAVSGKSGKELYTVPYLMSAFPGCTEDHMRALGNWLKKRNWSPRQVQCFIPTPGTVATAMFYAGIAPDGSPLYVARTDKERLEQHHLLLGGGSGSERRPAKGRPNAARHAGTNRRPFPGKGTKQGR